MSLTQTTAHDALEQAAEKTRAVVQLRGGSKIVSEPLCDLAYDPLPAASREHPSTLNVQAGRIHPLTRLILPTEI